jgi:hypothetical protein
LFKMVVELMSKKKNIYPKNIWRQKVYAKLLQ